MKFQQNRQVTQSIATQAVLKLHSLNRRSDPRWALLPSWNFDRFHPSCLFTKMYVKETCHRWCNLTTRSTWRVAWFIWMMKKYIFARCGPSPTYHLVPLAWCCMQYDTKPTRQYDSTLLLQGSLNTRAFSSPLRYRIIFTCSQILADPLLPLLGKDYRELNPFS